MKKLNISTPKYPNTFTLVDNEDFEYLNQWKWFPWLCNGIIYVVRVTYKKGGKGKIKKVHFLHKEIMGFCGDMEIDHINHNGLDNQKCNLRICTHGQNLMNRQKKIKKMSSKYKGVHRLFYKRIKKNYMYWMARIGLKNKRIYLGLWNTEEEAAKAYNCAARILFGEFACLNEVV